MGLAFGVDIGGSAVKLGIVDEDGNILGKSTFPLPKCSDLSGLTALTARHLNQLALEVGLTPSAIGISAPGHMEHPSGLALDGVYNVPALSQGSYPTELSKALGLPCTIENDGICATRGELEHGAGREVRDFALMTLGTGIGGALVINREIARGIGGKPPEFGAIVLRPQHTTHRQGLHGTLEDLASGKALIAGYAQRTGVPVASLNADNIRQRALAGDSIASASFDAMAGHIAHAFGTLVNLSGIRLCLVGGGISLAGDFLLERIRRAIDTYTWPYLARDVVVRATQHGNDSGLIGATATARQHLAKVLDGNES